MVTRKGIVKKTLLSEFEYQRKGGKIAIVLDEGDELEYVKHTNGSEEVIIATHDGMSARFAESEVRPMGRTARGVKGITLSGEDFVVGCAVVDDDRSLLSITEGGFGKRCKFDNFSAHSRGVKGVMCHGISERTGKLAGIAAVSETDDILMITNDGTIVRTPVSEIPFYGRSAGGVIAMKLSEGAILVNFAKVENEDETEALLTEADADEDTSDIEYEVNVDEAADSEAEGDEDCDI